MLLRSRYCGAELGMAIRDMLLPEFDHEVANARKILELLPEGKFDYRPHEKSMALGRLAGHVAELPGWAKETMTTEGLTMEPGKFEPFTPTTRAEVLDKFEKCVAAGRAAIENSTDDQYSVLWTFRAGSQVVFSMSRLAVLRGMVLSHMIHHRAQLGVYLRLNEIEIPGMYGPSADEMKFWEQAKA